MITVRGRWARTKAALAAITIAALASVVFPAGAAHAVPAAPAGLDLTCGDAPPATAPSEESIATVLGAGATQPPTGKDPFAPNSGTSVYREYGWPTEWWDTYDLACITPAAVAEPGAIIGTWASNFLTLPTVIGAANYDVMVHQMLDWSGLGWVDDALDSIVAEIRGQTWASTVGLVALAAALYFIVTAWRGDTRKTAMAAGWTLLASLIIAAMVSYPAKTAGMFDGVVRSAVLSAYGADASTGGDQDTQNQAIADTITGQTFNIAVYDRWCEGQVGGSRDAQQRWCPQLWKATYISRAEAAANKGDDRADLIADKSKEWKKIAGEIKDKDPAAFQHLQGLRPGTRIMAAFTSAGSLLISTFFPFWALLVLFVSLMLLRVAVVLAPIAGPFLLHPAARRAGQATGKLLGAAMLNAVVFAFASAIYLRIARVVLAADANLLVRLTTLLILTIAMWVAAKPWRRLFGMGKGVGSYMENTSDKMTAAHAGKSGVRLGMQAAQLYFTGRAATSAGKAAGAAEHVAENTGHAHNPGPAATVPQQYQPEPTPYDAPVPEPSSRPAPPAGSTLPPGAASTVRVTNVDNQGRVYESEGQVLTPQHPDYHPANADARYYSANKRTVYQAEPDIDPSVAPADAGDDGGGDAEQPIYTATSGGGDGD